MKVLMFAVALGVVAVGAARAENKDPYKMYNLPKDSPLDVPQTARDFFRAFGAKFGTKNPGLGGKVLGVESGMPDRCNNWEYGNLMQMTVNIQCQGTPIRFYVTVDAGFNAKQFVAFTADYQTIEWVVAQVKTEAKATAASLDDRSYRLATAFASRLGSLGTSAYAKDDVVDQALDLFIAELKTRKAGANTPDKVLTDFESQVKTMEVKAGNWVEHNDTGQELSDRAVALLPADLSH